jgi:hypothetical protein
VGVSDAGEHVDQPGLRFDVVELRRHEQRRHDSGAVGFGAGEEPRLPSQGKASRACSAASFVRHTLPFSMNRAIRSNVRRSVE